MQTSQQSQGRDERASVIGYSGGDPRGTRARDLPNHRDNSYRRSAVREDDRDQGPPPELRRIAKTIRVPSLKAPDGHGMAALLRAGKVISSQHYDFSELTQLGVELVPVDQEIVPVRAASEAGPSLSEVTAALALAGLRVVPADAPQAAPVPVAASSEVEALKTQNATMQAQLDEMRKSLAELTKKKG